MRCWVVLSASSFAATCSLTDNLIIFRVAWALCIYATSSGKGFKRTVVLRRKFNLHANLLNFSLRIDHFYESRISCNFLTCIWASINIFLRNLTTLLPASLSFGQSSTVRLVLIYFMLSFSEWIPHLYFWMIHLRTFFFVSFFCFCFLSYLWEVFAILT